MLKKKTIEEMRYIITKKILVLFSTYKTCSGHMMSFHMNCMAEGTGST